MSEFVNVGGEVIREGAVMTVFSDPVCQLSFSPDLTTWTYSGEIPLPPKPSRGQERAEHVLHDFPEAAGAVTKGLMRRLAWEIDREICEATRIERERCAKACWYKAGDAVKVPQWIYDARNERVREAFFEGVTTARAHCQARIRSGE